MTQEGDVLLYQTPDDGDISVTSGVVTMAGGLETSVYLSMFGGNEDDDGSQNNKWEWWGNIDEPNPYSKYRSATQNLIETLPLSSANLRRVEEAVKRDLEWMTASGVASEVSALATIPGLNKIQINVAVVADGRETTFEYTENWKVEL